MPLKLVDAHCHYSCAVTTEQQQQPHTRDTSLAAINHCIMATRRQDWDIIKTLQKGTYVGFGVHPWYSHHFYTSDQKGLVDKDKNEHYRNILAVSDKYKDELEEFIQYLPDPISLDEYINDAISNHLSVIDVIGEIGLDKNFNLISHDRKVRSHITVKMDHQVNVFTTFLELAKKINKPISIHDVNRHSLIFELCKKILLIDNDCSINICLHSFTGSNEMLHAWIDSFGNRLFISLSSYINYKNKDTTKIAILLRGIDKERVLTETDYEVDLLDSKDWVQEIKSILACLCDIYNTTEAQMCEIVYSNWNKYIE